MTNSPDTDSREASCVLFAIGVAQGGAGGHYQSLAAISTAIRNTSTAKVVVTSIGRRRSPAIDALSDQGILVEHIPFAGWNLVAAGWRFVRLCQSSKCDVIHVFDDHAYVFARIANLFLGIGIVLTKCGGPSPHRYYPYARVQTVFSEEDRSWFLDHRDQEVVVIPNRIGKVDQNNQLIDRIRRRIPNSITILRVTRIAKHYQKTLADSIRLAALLADRGWDVSLIIVGRVYDVALFNEIRSSAPKNVYWFTESRYSRDAKQIIDVADMVIGTGRSLMEAASRGRTVLCPVAGQRFPSLLTENNFQKLFEKNFSERAVLMTNEETELYQIEQRLKHGQSSEERNFLAKIAKEYFDIGAAVPRYLESYRTAMLNRDYLLKSLPLSAARTVYVFLRQRWREWRAARQFR